MAEKKNVLVPIGTGTEEMEAVICELQAAPPAWLSIPWAVRDCCLIVFTYPYLCPWFPSQVLMCSDVQELQSLWRQWSRI